MPSRAAGPLFWCGLRRYAFAADVDFHDGAFEGTGGIEALDLPMAKGMDHDLDEIELLGVDEMGEIGQEILDPGFKRFVLALIGREKSAAGDLGVILLKTRRHETLQLDIILDQLISILSNETLTETWTGEPSPSSSARRR